MIANKVATRTTRRCAIYTRKSTDHGLDQDFNSLDAQREACEAFIRSRAHEGWQIVEERYDDGGYSGKDTERPAFRRLIADVDAGRVDLIVVYKLDRLSRSLLDFVHLIERLDGVGAAFASVTESFSSADPIGRLILHILMSFAEFEREQIAQRVRDKVHAARRKGKWTGGIAPLGYAVVDRRLVIDPNGAALVRVVVARYRALLSAVATAQDLNEGGIVRRHADGTGRRWTKHDVLRLLQNPVYAGYVPCNGKLHEGEHEAILPRAEWEELQRLVAANRASTTRRGRNHDYLLRGVLRCGRCGGAMTPAPTVRRNRVYRYYRCMTRDKGGVAACAAPQLAADAVETAVAGRLRGLAIGAAVRDEAIAAAHQQVALLRKTGSSDVAADAGGSADVASARLALERIDGAWELLTAENRARLVRLLVDQVVVDGAHGEVEIRLAAAVREMAQAS